MWCGSGWEVRCHTQSVHVHIICHIINIICYVQYISRKEKHKKHTPRLRLSLRWVCVCWCFCVVCVKLQIRSFILLFVARNDGRKRRDMPKHNPNMLNRRCTIDGLAPSRYRHAFQVAANNNQCCESFGTKAVSELGYGSPC